MNKRSLGRLLARLEIPDCGCGTELPCGCRRRQAGEACDCPSLLSPPCHHILARDHGLAFADWIELLWAARPKEYREPPPPAKPHRVLQREAKVAVLAARRAAGVALRHPQDLDALDVDRLGRTLELLGNRHPVECGLEIQSAEC